MRTSFRDRHSRCQVAVIRQWLELRIARAYNAAAIIVVHNQIARSIRCDRGAIHRALIGRIKIAAIVRDDGVVEVESSWLRIVRVLVDVNAAERAPCSDFR